MTNFITVDLGFGDGGKGTIVDALVREFEATLVVRYNGGSQASHSVYSEAGKHHAFSQFGSGTFKPGCCTFLSQFMMVNPLVMQVEEEHLRECGVTDAWTRMFIDGRALMTTPYHRALNRLKELSRGDARHGSCGVGIGETMAYALENPEYAVHVGDLHTIPMFAGRMMEMRDRLAKQAMKLTLPDNPEVDRQLGTFRVDFDQLWPRYEQFYKDVGNRIYDPYASSQLITNNKTIVFEGAQGILLDENCGFHPYTTWSTCTTRNAKLILEEAEVTETPMTIGVTRTYSTRHGAGPFPTEDQEMTRLLVDPNNPFNAWQTLLRCGPLDLPLMRYALKCNGPVDCIALTHIDKVKESWPICTSYEREDVLWKRANLLLQEELTNELFKMPWTRKKVTGDGFARELIKATGTPIAMTSRGPYHTDKLLFDVLETMKRKLVKN